MPVHAHSACAYATCTHDYINVPKILNFAELGPNQFNAMFNSRQNLSTAKFKRYTVNSEHAQRPTCQ